MDNTQRRIAYLTARRGISADHAATIVAGAYRGGVGDRQLGLTPAQVRRLRRHRSGEAAPGPAQARAAAVQAARAARWDVLAPRPPRPGRAVPVASPDAPVALPDESRLHRAAQRRASRASRALALVRRKAG